MSDTPPPPPTTPSGPVSEPSKSWLARMFDLSFSEFVTPSIIKIIFVVGLIMSALFSLLILIGFASQGGGMIVVGLLLAPLAFFFYALMARVMSEIYLILFRIEENTRS